MKKKFIQNFSSCFRRKLNFFRFIDVFMNFFHVFVKFVNQFINANYDKFIQIETIKFFVIKFDTISTHHKKIINKNCSNNNNLFKSNKHNWNCLKKYYDNNSFIFDRNNVYCWNNLQNAFSFNFDYVFQLKLLRIVQILKKFSYFF